MIDLWGYDIGRFVWFCAAGKSFFPGVGLLILAAVLPIYKRVIWIDPLRYTFIILGVVLIFLSATPLYGWFYVIWGLAFVAFLYVVLQWKKDSRKSAFIRIIFILICLTAIVMELPFHLSPRMPNKSCSKLYVIGDSVSAGIGGKGEKSWPVILSKQYNINIANLAVAGATVGSAIPQANRIVDDNTIILLEIGGNDLFGPTPPAQFENDLRNLLQKVVNSNRAVIMLELPLRSCDIEYGMIQRKLAKRYNVMLIPKEFMASVFAEKDATVDLVHLSSKGHQLMADKVWALLKDSFTKKDTTANK